MAQKNALSSTLRLSFEAGMDPLGKAIIKRKNFTNISIGSADAVLFSTAQAIASLQNYPLLEVGRIDNAALLA